MNHINDIQYLDSLLVCVSSSSPLHCGVRDIVVCVCVLSNSIFSPNLSDQLPFFQKPVWLPKTCRSWCHGFLRMERKADSLGMSQEGTTFPISALDHFKKCKAGSVPLVMPMAKNSNEQHISPCQPTVDHMVIVHPCSLKPSKNCLHKVFFF